MARILVIDDESNVRMMLRLALQHVGHTVQTAADGQEGLDRYGSGEDWDLVLLDQRMPGMEGLDVLREIRSRVPQAKVILITAFGTIDLAREASKAGASDFLRKPFTAEILRGAVDAVLREEDRQPASGLMTINGFRITPKSESGTSYCTFIVENPEGARRECAVILATDVLTEIEKRVDRGDRASTDRIQSAICMEALTNYVWQHSEVPLDGKLQVDELSTGLRKQVGLDQSS